jgi:predicted DNA-binding transcriptional regulator YafY
MQRVIERGLNLLAFLVTAERPVTADEIRSTVAGYDQEADEAFRRTFERDKDLLRRLGIPLEMRPTDAWEVEFGYVVPDEAYAVDDPGLSDDERTALLLAAQAVRFGGQVAGPDAILKLGGAAGGGGGEPLGADLGTSADLLAEVFSAVTERRIATFEYRDRQRTVHPYGLVHKLGHWYLVGPEASGDTTKAFRVDRTQGFAVGDQAGAFDRPASFRAADQIPEEPWAAGTDSVAATVRFDPDVAWIAERQLGERSEVTKSADGGIEAVIPVANPGAFLGWLVGFEASVELLGPAELRERFLTLIRAGT